MSAVTLTRPSSRALSDRQLYRLLFAVTYPAFLATVAVLRLGRWIGQIERPAGTPASLFAEARATSSGALLYAFMG